MKYGGRDNHSIELKRFTDATLAADGLLADIRKSRRRGYFVTRGEFDPGGMGVARAFPVEAEAFAVGVAGPMSRMKDKLEAVGKAVSDAAAAMSRAAGRA